MPKEKLPYFPKPGGELKPGSSLGILLPSCSPFAFSFLPFSFLSLVKDLENFVTHLLNDNLYMETNPKFLSFMNAFAREGPH